MYVSHYIRIYRCVYKRVYVSLYNDVIYTNINTSHTFKNLAITPFAQLFTFVFLNILTIDRMSIL
ncbi:hypothetical protein EFS57_01135 [Leuconostoc falkenbergense]|nr:hypothetical protein [Leuconostoc falkenbergense]